MITTIRKRTGDIVKFNAQKIADAIKKANMESIDETFSSEQLDEITNGVIKALKSVKMPCVEQIQDTVEKVLIAGNFASTAKAYILYRAEHTKLRQAKADLMDIYNELTFAKAKDADIKRENANIDADTAMGTMLKYGSEGSKYFITSNILPKDIAVAHMNGDIHIHDMDFYMLTETCCQIDLLKLFKNGFSTGHGYLREPNDIRSYAALACIAIQANQNEMHGGQAVPMFDYCMAPGVEKTYRKQYYKALAYYFNAMLDMELNDAKLLCKAIEKAIPIQISMGKVDEFGRELVKYLPKHQRENNYQEIDEHTTKLAHKFATNTAWNETDAATYQAMEAFIHNLNTMNSRAGAQVPFSSINYGTDISPEGRMAIKNLLLATDAGLGDGETPIFPVQIFKVKEGVNYEKDEPNYDLFRLAMKTSAKRLFPNFSFLDAPFNKKYYQEGNPETEATYMGCRTRVMSNVCGDNQASGRGNLSFTTINLPRLGIKHGILKNNKADLDGFFKELDEKIDLVIDELLERMQIQANKKVKNFPFLMGQGVWKGSEDLGAEDKLEEVIKQGTLTLGFIGLAECLIALTGKHHGESDESQELGLRIISHMRQRMDEASKKYNLNFSLIATPAEGLSGRFTSIDKKLYGNIKGITDKEYYTNSFHVPVYYEISAYDKIKKEAPYHTLTNGGHITYVELDGDTSNNLEAFETIIKAMKELGIGYGSVNHPVDRDPICGYSGVIEGDICPNCGRNEYNSNIKFERIRRITGYLVGTVDRFNDAKKAEVRDRVKHR